MHNTTVWTVKLVKHLQDNFSTIGVAKGDHGGPEPPLGLADQVTLLKTGGQIMPLTLQPAPRIKKAI